MCHDGRQSGNFLTGNNPVEILNSGNIVLRAGGDVAGGNLYEAWRALVWPEIRSRIVPT